MPFERDADFIERDTLDEIRDKLAPQTARAALIGLGGVGYGSACGSDADSLT